MKAKHIGIAAITAEGGALAYREIVKAFESVLGRDKHSEITLHSFSFSEYTTNKGDRQEIWGNLLLESSRKLAAAGAEFFICPANTNHIAYETVCTKVAIPWLHIAAVVGEYGNHRGCERSLLLGTKSLVTSDVYPRYFSTQGIEVVLPLEQEQEEVFRIIYEELVRGAIRPESKSYVASLIRKYAAEQKCDSVVLGCTELPLLISESDCDITVLDSTRILAWGAVAKSLGISLEKVSEPFEKA